MRTKLFSFVPILLIGLQLVKAQSSNANCDSPWNISIDGDHLTWQGDERDANVTIILEPDTLNGTQVTCSKMILNVPFSEREVYVDSRCANSFHLVNATVVCNDLSYVEYTELSGDVPGAPLNLSAVKDMVTSISITIEWLPPLSSDSIDRYNIQKSETEGLFTEKALHTTETKYELGGLSPYTNYYIRVSASNENLNGPWSTINQTTKTSIPFPPNKKDIELSSTNSSILVKWKEPTPNVGPILEYTISWEIHGSPETAETKELEETSYNIENLNAYTNYSIKVRAMTEAGIGHWSGAVVFSTDIGVPTVPRNLSSTNTSSTSIVLSWEPPDPENGPILNYQLSWGTIGRAMSKLTVSETQYKAKLLKPYTEYMFQVAAKTKAGLGSYTGVLNVWTDIDLPSQPINLKISEIRNTSIFLKWSEPEKPNGPLLPYLMKVTDHIGNSLMELETESTNYTVEGLLPYTKYFVQVCAQTEAGRGEWTRELSFRTEIGIPSPPKNLSDPTVLPTRIFLNWTVPDSPAGPFLDYLVKWGVRGTELSLFVTVDTNYEAIGLRPYTEYLFGVAARTEAGVGESEVLIIRTDIAAPSVPGDLSDVKTTDHSVFITWSPPQHPNGPDVLYLVQWADIFGNLTSLANTTSTEYLIENLEGNTNYSVQVAALTSVGQGPWTEMVFVTTDIKGSAFNLKLILGLVLGLALPLLILIIAGIVITIRKGGLTFLSSISSSETTKKEPSPYQYDNPSVQMGVYNAKPKPLTVHNFEERLNRPMYSSRIELVKEFGDLKENSPQHPCNAAKLEQNLAKNRWVKMLPYDHSRVKLFPFDDKLKPDFINANYIPGDSYLLEYIASQGPLKETMDDFWTMIWQQSVSVVVMLTQCVEKAVKNCEQYWPASGQNRMFGEIQVYTQSESVLSSYVVRVLAVQFRSQKRHVVHMHFSNWPVSGCPRTPDEFLHFVRKVREQTSDRRPGPILVHCSAGVGRTGTFIAVDRLFQHLEHSDDIDIYGTVFDMRRYRPHMVHTDEQYTFIYACVKRYLQERKEPRESLYEVAL